MTLQEAKDEVAKKHGSQGWGYIIMQRDYMFDQLELLDEVAELYARSKWDEAAWESYITNHGASSYCKPEFK